MEGRYQGLELHLDRARTAAGARPVLPRSCAAGLPCLWRAHMPKCPYALARGARADGPRQGIRDAPASPPWRVARELMARTSRAPRAPNSQYDFLAIDYDEHRSDHHHHGLAHKEHEHLLQEIALLLGVAPPTGIPCLPGFTPRAPTPLRSITA